MLWINETKLNLLLEEKKQFIGAVVVWDSVISSASFLISVLLASYEEVFGRYGFILKLVFVVLGLVFTAKSIHDVLKSKRNSYSYKDLFDDINRLNEITHNHSIIAIKNTFEEFPNKFLLYEDKRWNCRLFINYKENINNESYIINHVSNELKVPVSDITIKYLAQEVGEKFSESHHEQRVYLHRLYQVEINNIPDCMKKDSFIIEGTRYYWESIRDMEQDERIAMVNSDIVNLVKRNCL